MQNKLTGLSSILDEFQMQAPRLEPTFGHPFLGQTETLTRQKVAEQKPIGEATVKYDFSPTTAKKNLR